MPICVPLSAVGTPLLSLSMSLRLISFWFQLCLCILRLLLAATHLLCALLHPSLHMCLCRVWFFLAFKERVVSLITEVERKAKVTCH